MLFLNDIHYKRLKDTETVFKKNHPLMAGNACYSLRCVRVDVCAQYPGGQMFKTVFLIIMLKGTICCSCSPGPKLLEAAAKRHVADCS